MARVERHELARLGRRRRPPPERNPVVRVSEDHDFPVRFRWHASVSGTPGPSRGTAERDDRKDEESARIARGPRERESRAHEPHEVRADQEALV